MQEIRPAPKRISDHPDGEMLVSTTDRRGVITHCNEAFARVSGHSMEALIGQPHSMP